ncbi:MAG: type II toxin-antitoxin system VapC family toxin [Burkholderiales bacterium]|jgi:predicted nucleic acid-binding protein|nr:type II toxin-antitoxin system VapC family toxin [Burkholderiales bacterium]
MTFVVDSSVAVAWCFAEERTPATAALLDRVTISGATAPSLWPLEVLNALLVAEKRKRVDFARRHELIKELQSLPITLDTETAAQAWGATNRLAGQHRLTIYDAAYLELAQRLDLPLATLDADLRDAANALGVPLLGAPEDIA